jgi:hypothetical protein
VEDLILRLLREAEASTSVSLPEIVEIWIGGGAASALRASDEPVYESSK